MLRTYIHLLSFLFASALDLNVAFYQGEPVQVNINDPNSQIKFSQTSDNSLVYQVYSPATNTWSDPMYISCNSDIKNIMKNGGVIHPTSTGGVIAYAPTPEEVLGHVHHPNEGTYAQSAPASTESAQRYYAGSASASYAQPAPVAYAQPAPTTYAQPAPATYAQPAPVTYAQPAPTSYAHPAPTSYAHPTPVVTSFSGASDQISGTQKGSGASVVSPVSDGSDNTTDVSSKDEKSKKDKDSKDEKTGKDKNGKDKDGKDKDGKDKNSKNLKDKDSDGKSKKKNGLKALIIVLSSAFSFLMIYTL